MRGGIIYVDAEVRRARDRTESRMEQPSQKGSKSPSTVSGTSTSQCCSSTVTDRGTATMSEHAGDAAAGVGLDDDFLADPTEEREEVFPGVRLEGEQGKLH